MEKVEIYEWNSTFNDSAYKDEKWETEKKDLIYKFWGYQSNDNLYL